MARFRILLVALVPAALLGGIAIRLASRGHPAVLPLDDAYMYLQYARTAIGGCPGAYFHGGPLSSGFTSPLWFGILTVRAAVLEAVGMGAAGLPWSALVADALAVALGFWLLLRLARIHGVRGPAAGLPILLLVLIPLWIFGAMNGMETGLYGASLIAAAWVLAGGSEGWLVLPALVRPEGALVALAILGVRRIARGRLPLAPDGDPPRVSRRRWAPAVLVVAAALFTLLLPYLSTGAPPAGWTAKALATEPKPEVRGFYLPRLLYFAGRTLWFGVSGGRMQPPVNVIDDLRRPDAWIVWVWAIFLTGGAALSLIRGRGRGPLLLWIPATLLSLLAVAWDAQFYRYLVPALPLLILAATAGWFAGNATGPGRFLRAVGGTLFAVLALGTLLPPPGYATRFRRLYRGECEKIEARQVRTGRWIAGHLPPEAKVATHDVGAIAFIGERPVVDLVGLVTPALAGASRHGEGALWEALSALPPRQRPAYAAVVPAWMPYLSRTLWFKERLWSAGEPASSRGSAPGRAFEVWSLSWPGEDSTRWSAGDLGEVPTGASAVAGGSDLEIVDGVDVADIPSERAHAYRQEPPSLRTDVRNLDFGMRASPGQSPVSAIEGGREATAVTRFFLRARPGETALLVLRSTATGRRHLEIRIGGWTGLLVIPRSEIRFCDSSTLIPSSALTPGRDGRVPVEVRGDGYCAFHWWLLQGKGDRD